MPTEELTAEEEAVFEGIYGNLDKLSGLSKHSEELVAGIYSDLEKLFKLMQEIING